MTFIPGRGSSNVRHTPVQALSDILRELKDFHRDEGLPGPLPTGASTETKQDSQITLATSMNGTLTSMLSSLNASQDLEILLVRDTGDSDVVVQQIREYDIDTGAFAAPIYQKVDGTTHTVIGPLEYLDASAVLNLILTELMLKADLTETQPVSATSLPLPTGAATEATLAIVETNTDYGTVVGGGAEATALRVTIANDSTGTVATTSALGTIGTGSSVADSATVVTLQALNINRISLKVFNNSSAILYVREGAGATTSAFTWKLFTDEAIVIDDYSGIVTGIWATAPGGNAQVTETT